MDEIEAAIQAEYDRCKELWQRPESAPGLFGVEGVENVRKYYEYRTEALGFALDRFARVKRGEKP